MFQINMLTDNAAYGNDARYEIARQLEALAAEVTAGRSFGTIRDHNGNTCGSWEYDCTYDEDAIAPSTFYSVSDRLTAALNEARA